MAVNPAVKNNKRVADIISDQRKIIKEYKAAFQYFQETGKFSLEELSYLEKVYSNLIDKSVNNVDALLMVITASKLRMSDAERIAAIDRIFSNIDEQLTFLRHFNNETKILAIQRTRQETEVKTSRKLYDVNQLK
jgi:hypothetical protein